MSENGIAAEGTCSGSNPIPSQTPPIWGVVSFAAGQNRTTPLDSSLLQVVFSLTDAEGRISEIGIEGPM